MPGPILDTTFFIDLRKGDLGATELWSSIRNGDLSASFSSITTFELWVGVGFQAADEEFYQGMFEFLEEVRPSAVAAAQAATWLRNLPRSTRNDRFRDALIAATAWERRERVYTRNIRDFCRYYTNVETY